MSKRMGIRLGGNEQALEDLIHQHWVARGPNGRAYTVVEIGSAGCVTLRAFRDIVAETCGSYPWSVIGFDLPPGKAWSMDMGEVERSLAGVDYSILRLDKQTYPDDMVWHNKVMLCLYDDPRSWMRLNMLDGGVDFCFIDGSHGKSCGYDFLTIEPKMARGGLVVFHDYGELEQGTDWQFFDNEFINVRTYVHRLGLNQPTNRLRKGWRWVAEIPGSRRFGGDGNSCAVVQRTEERLEADAPRV